MSDPGYSHLAHANDLEPSVGHRTLRERCPVHTETAHDPPFHVIGRHADVFDVLTLEVRGMHCASCSARCCRGAPSGAK